jgi:hypothetical protein
MRRMQVIDTRELERLVRRTFPEKRHFSADKELGPDAHRWPVVTFVHSGTDVFLDRQFDDWLRGSPIFVSVHQLLNRLCRAGVLSPGEYAVTRER